MGPLAVQFDEVLVSDDLGPDEPAGQVGVYGSRRVHRVVSRAQGPGAYLVLSAGEKGDQPQEAVGFVDQAVSPQLLDGEVFHELRLLCRVQLSQVHLQGSEDPHGAEPFFAKRRLQRLDLRYRARLSLVHVQDHQLGFQGEKGEAAQGLFLFLRQGIFAKGKFFHQMVLQLFQKLPFCRFFGSVFFLCREPGKTVFDDAQVAVDQLRFHDLPVPQRINGFLRVRDVRVFKKTHHVQQRVRFRHEGEKGVPQPRAFAGVPGQSRQVHELHRGGGCLSGLEDLRQFVEPRVRNADQSAIRLRFSAGVGFHFRAGSGDDVEDRGFPAKGQTDYSAL